MFLTKAACCQNIEIILNPTALSFTNVLWCDASTNYVYVYHSSMYMYIHIFINKWLLTLK